MTDPRVWRPFESPVRIGFGRERRVAAVERSAVVPRTAGAIPGWRLRDCFHRYQQRSLERVGEGRRSERNLEACSARSCVAPVVGLPDVSFPLPVCVSLPRPW